MGARAKNTGVPAARDPRTKRRGNAGAAANATNRVAVLVAGMHRSGTSLLTQVLVGLGCDAPKTLMEADEYNGTGYWESTKVTALNDAMLKSAGSAWDDWEHLNADWFASPAALAFRPQAQALLESEFADSSLFVLKDPRLCRLLPFWCDVAQRIGAEPRIAISLRNPLETVASLADRDAIPQSVGMLLWLRNVLAAEEGSRPHRRAFARYDDTLEDWSTVAERLGSDLGVVWPKPSATAAIELDQRVSPALRHQKADDALADPALSRWTRSTFDILSRWARGQRDADDAGRLDAVRSEFDDACAVFRQPVIVSARLGKRNSALEKELQAQGNVIAARDREIDSLGQAVRDRDEVIAGHQGRRDSLRQAVRDRDEVIARHEVQLDSLNQAVRDRDEVIARHEVQLDSLSRAVRDRDDVIDGLNKDIERQQEQLASQDQAIVDRDVRTDALIHAVAERDGMLNATNETVQARDRQIGQMNTALIERDVRIDRLGSVVAKHEARANTLANRVAERDERLAWLGEKMTERDVRIDQLASAVAEHEARASALANSVAERDDRLAWLGEKVAERDVRIDQLGSAVAEHEARASALTNTIAERDMHLAQRDERIAERDERIAERDDRIGGLRQALADGAAHASELNKAIDALRSSTSWRVTKPLRWVRTVFGGEPSDGEAAGGEAAGEEAPSAAVAARTPRPRYYALRAFWRLLPVGAARRTRWKGRIVKALPDGAGRHLLSRAPSARTYGHCGRLDLADRNFEASRNNAAVPILFDPEYYLATNDDVRAAEQDPLTHYMEAGYSEGRLPIDIADDELDPLIRDLHRCDLSAPDAFAFDPAFYGALHADLAGLDDAALRTHYQKHGHAESRICSKGEFLQTICDSPREIPIDFRADEYLGLYPDLQAGFANKPALEVLRHYMSAGRWEPRLHTLRNDNGQSGVPSPAGVDTAAEPVVGAKALCVLAHVYYPELWPELSGYLANLAPNCHDLYVNLVDTTFTQELLTSVRDDFPEARVFISKNEGRDIGGHFQTLRNIRMADYPLFCLVHTKKSPHMGKGEVQLWRRKLLTPLLGTAETASDNVRLLLADESIGMLGAERCRYTQLNDNPDKYFELLDRLGVREEHRVVDFLSGTMMFLRREVLERVFVGVAAGPGTATEAGEVAIEFERGDEKSLTFHRDGQWAHAIERVFPAVARDMGLRVEWR